MRSKQVETEGVKGRAREGGNMISEFPVRAERVN